MIILFTDYESSQKCGDFLCSKTAFFLPDCYAIHNPVAYVLLTKECPVTRNRDEGFSTSTSNPAPAPAPEKTEEEKQAEEKTNNEKVNEEAAQKDTDSESKHPVNDYSSKYVSFVASCDCRNTFPINQRNSVKSSVSSTYRCRSPGRT